MGNVRNVRNEKRKLCKHTCRGSVCSIQVILCWHRILPDSAPLSFCHTYITFCFDTFPQVFHGLEDLRIRLSITHPCPTHPKLLGKKEGTAQKRRTNCIKELFTWFCRSFCDYDFESWKRKEKTDWWWINLVLANLSGLELPVRLVREHEPEHGGAERGVDLLHPGLQLAVGRGRGRGGWRGAWAWAPPTKPPHFSNSQIWKLWISR